MSLVASNQKKTRVTFDGQPILSKKVKSDHPMTKQKIIAEITELQAESKKRNTSNYDLQISLRYQFGWRSGKMFDISDGEADIFDPADYYVGNDAEFKKKFGDKIQDTFTKFVIYFVPKGGKAGGKDYHNDCLYNCLYSVLLTGIPKGWDTKRGFKIIQSVYIFSNFKFS